jgi:hypothetical protein
VWLALSEIRADGSNGGLCVLPKLHAQGALPTEAADGAADEFERAICSRFLAPRLRCRVCYALRPGGAGVHGPWTPHASAANTSDAPRLVLVLRYARAAPLEARLVSLRSPLLSPCSDLDPNPPLPAPPPPPTHPPTPSLHPVCPSPRIPQARGEQLWRLDARTGREEQVSLQEEQQGQQGQQQQQQQQQEDAVAEAPPRKRARGSRCQYLCWSTGELFDRHCYLLNTGTGVGESKEW